MSEKRCHRCKGKMRKTVRKMKSTFGKEYAVTIYICESCGFETTSGY